jgi:oligosaccharide repeat unit polymerase
MATETSGALAMSAVLVAWAAAMRAASGTWLQPSALFALCWSVAGIVPLIVTPNDPVSAGSMIWIIAASIAVSAGAIAGNGGFRTRLARSRPYPSRAELQTLMTIMLISLIAGIGSNIAFAMASGVAFGELLDLQTVAIVSNRLYVARYAAPDAVQPAPPLLSQALLPFVFLAPAVGGMVFVLSRRRGAKFLAVLTMLPAIGVTVLQNTKAAVLFSGILWSAAYFASRLRLGRLAVFTRRHLAVAALIGLVVTIFFFFIGLARLASIDLGLLDVVRVKLYTSAFGHMTGFSRWLSDYWSNARFGPTLGAYTFGGPLDVMGIQKRLPGIFIDFVELAIGDTSNIYTAFRPLIQDFTLPGAIAMLTLVGFVGGIAFRLVAAGRWAAVPVLIGVYATIMWTPITWFWVYNSLTAAVLGLCIVLFCLRMWRVSRATMIDTGIGHRNASGLISPL